MPKVVPVATEEAPVIDPPIDAYAIHKMDDQGMDIHSKVKHSEQDEKWKK